MSPPLFFLFYPSLLLLSRLSERVNALEEEDPIGYTDGKLTELTATINAVNTSLASPMEMVPTCVPTKSGGPYSFSAAVYHLF